MTTSFGLILSHSPFDYRIHRKVHGSAWKRHPKGPSPHPNYGSFQHFEQKKLDRASLARRVPSCMSSARQGMRETGRTTMKTLTTMILALGATALLGTTGLYAQT